MDEVIQTDPRIMHGTPCFAGTRVPIQHLFDYVAAGESIEEFLQDYPTVTREQVLTVVRLASHRLTGAAA